MYIKGKSKRQLRIERYQLILVPERPFQRIIIDYITKLLESQDLIIGTLYDIILIIVEELIKYAKFISYNSIITIELLIYLLIGEVFTNYEVLEQIILDK